MKSFHNTTGESGQDLNKFESTAKTQEGIIKDIFANQNKGMTASEVHTIYPSDKTPLTSIRRGMTNLCKEGILFITPHKRTGLYGRPEHIYKQVGDGNLCASCQNCNCEPDK